MQKITSFILLLSFSLFLGAITVQALPLRSPIFSPTNQRVGTALVYMDYVEILGADSKLKGKVAFVNLKGRFELLIIREDSKKTIVGRANNRRIYNQKEELIGTYDWTTFWIYVYAQDGKNLGRAKCIAFRGVCAAGVASYLTGLLGTP